MKRTSQPQRPLVTADGDGVVGHAGNLLLQELADRLGLNSGPLGELGVLLRAVAAA